MWESQKMPTAPRSAPATMIGRVPMRANSLEAIPEATATPRVVGMYAAPAWMREKPSTFCM